MICSKTKTINKNALTNRYKKRFNVLKMKKLRHLKI